VQDHVHDRDDVGEGLLFLSVKGPGLEGGEILGSEFFPGLQVIERLAQESAGADRTVVDGLADLGIDDLDDGAADRPRSSLALFPCRCGGDVTRECGNKAAQARHVIMVDEATVFDRGSWSRQRSRGGVELLMGHLPA
jgi:hypothetical protein